MDQNQRNKRALVLFCLMAVLVVALSFIFPSNRRNIGISLEIFLILAFLRAINAILSFSMKSANPYVPDYAVTIREQDRKDKDVRFLGGILFVLFLVDVVYIIGLFSKKAPSWWFVPGGIVLLFLVFVLGFINNN